MNELRSEKAGSFGSAFFVLATADLWERSPIYWIFCNGSVILSPMLSVPEGFQSKHGCRRDHWTDLNGSVM